MTTQEHIAYSLRKAWGAHKAEDQTYATTYYLLTAVQLIYDQIRAQEARSLPCQIPQDAPEASEPPFDQLTLEDRYKRQSEAIAEALRRLKCDCKSAAIEELEKVL